MIDTRQASDDLREAAFLLRRALEAIPRHYRDEVAHAADRINMIDFLVFSPKEMP